MHLSIVTVGELRKGLSLLPQGKRRRQLEEWLEHFLLPFFANRVLPATEPIGSRWGMLSAERQLRGTPLNMADGLIAATALEHDLTLVTRNVRDFANLGLVVVNPWDIP
jgi:toxin FitB